MSKYMVDHPELVQHYFEEHADKLNIGDDIQIHMDTIDLNTPLLNVPA